MPSVPSRLLPTVIKAMRRNRNYLDPATARDHLKDVSLRPRPYGPPARLRRDVTVTIDRSGQWPIYTIVPAAREPHGNTVYVHGGGWVNEIVSQHWHLAAQIASEAQTTVTVPIYPLVPFGTAGQVVPAIAELVRANHDRYGTVCLAGDSAGGQIALSAAIALRDEHALTLPRTVLISAALDLSLSNPEIDLVQPTDPWLAREAPACSSTTGAATSPSTTRGSAPSPPTCTASDRSPCSSAPATSSTPTRAWSSRRRRPQASTSTITPATGFCTSTRSPPPPRGEPPAASSSTNFGHDDPRSGDLIVQIGRARPARVVAMNSMSTAPVDAVITKSYAGSSGAASRWSFMS